MTVKYDDQYRITSSRLEHWDYGRYGRYFVTICTRDHETWMGEIANGKMVLLDIGKMADEYWRQIADHFPYAKLDVFVIMPNHVHGIIIIDKQDGWVSNKRRKTMSRPKIGGVTGNKNPMLHDNLSRIIRWYKGRVTFESRKINPNFAWQPRFHDHIIRDDKSYHRISEYIINNVAKWPEDRFYME